MILRQERASNLRPDIVRHKPPQHILPQHDPRLTGGVDHQAQEVGAERVEQRAAVLERHRDREPDRVLAVDLVLDLAREVGHHHVAPAADVLGQHQRVRQAPALRKVTHVAPKAPHVPRRRHAPHDAQHAVLVADQLHLQPQPGVRVIDDRRRVLGGDEQRQRRVRQRLERPEELRHVAPAVGPRHPAQLPVPRADRSDTLLRPRRARRQREGGIQPSERHAPLGVHRRQPTQHGHEHPVAACGPRVGGERFEEGIDLCFDELGRAGEAAGVDDGDEDHWVGVAAGW